jgi:capsular polysaccharide biosynthesis protein
VAKIHGGFLVETPDKAILLAQDAEKHIRPRDSLLHLGARIAVVCTSSTSRIDTPLLYVPGLSAHYTNYFHYFGQIHPRLLAFWMSDLGKNAMVAIPEFAPKFVSELLEMSGVPADVIFRIPSDVVCEASQVRILNPTRHDFQATPSDLQRVRSSLAYKSSGKPRRRLFLSRPLKSTQTQGRRLMNENEIGQLLSDEGFEIVDPAELSLGEQRQLFSEASVICGPTGAALTNALLLPEDAHVICLSPRETCRTYYPGLLLGSNIRFTWVLGSYLENASASHRFPHLPYEVPCELVKAAL